MILGRIGRVCLALVLALPILEHEKKGKGKIVIDIFIWTAKNRT